MSSSATLADYASESKWRSLPMWQAVSRSLVFHSCIWTTILVLSIRAIGTPGYDRHAILIEFDSRYPDNSAVPRPTPIAHTVSLSASPLTAPLTNPLLNPTENAIPRSVENASPNRLLPSASTFRPPLVTSTSNRKGPVVTVQRPPRPNPAIAVHNLKAPNQATPAPVNASAPQPHEFSAGPTSTPLVVESPKGIGSTLVGGAQTRAMPPSLHPKFGRPYPREYSRGRNEPPYIGPGAIDTGPAGRGVFVQGVNTAGTVRINNLASISTFRELDAKACHAFYRGESIENDNPAGAQNCYREALQIMQVAVPILEKESGPEHSEMAFALFNVGRCYHHLKEYGTAANYFRQADGMYSRVQGAQSQTRGNALVWLADTLIAQGKDDEAEGYLLESLPIYLKCFGEKHELVGHTYNRLAGICERTNRSREAESYREKANSILATAKVPGKN